MVCITLLMNNVYKRQRDLLRSSGNMNKRPDLAKGKGGGLDPWTWRLAESSPRGQAGELLLLLFEAKQGTVQVKWRQQRRGLGLATEIRARTGFFSEVAMGLGCRGAEALSDELLLLDADRGIQGTRRGLGRRG